MNTKPKVLVRSHAMREETSPPRAPTPTNDNIIYECNKLIPSPTTSPCLSPQNGKPVVVLSPSLSRGSSPCRTPTCSSPTSTLTLVPSPSSRCSSQNEGSLNATNRLQVCVTMTIIYKFIILHLYRSKIQNANKPDRM